MNLSSNWIIEPVFDFEYKKYQLLAYLKTKREELNASRIFPHLEELESHQNTLHHFLTLKNHLDDSFRKEIIGMNLAKGEIRYSQEKKDSNLNELMDIVNYSYEKINGCHHHFHQEAEEIKKKIHIELSGLLPSYLQEGFLLIRQQSGIFVFNYLLHPLLKPNGEKKFSYQYIEKHTPTLQEDSIKKELMKRYRKQFDHPVFFEVSTSQDYPIYETILPLATTELNRWTKKIIL